MPGKSREKRGRRLTIRFTDAEFHELLQGANKLRMSEAGYARYLILKVSRQMVDGIVEIGRDIRDIQVNFNSSGNNINQAVRALHIVNKGENKEKIEQSANELWNVLREIKKYAIERWEKISPPGVTNRRKRDATE